MVILAFAADSRASVGTQSTCALPIVKCAFLNAQSLQISNVCIHAQTNKSHLWYYFHRFCQIKLWFIFKFQSSKQKKCVCVCFFFLKKNEIKGNWSSWAHGGLLTSGLPSFGSDFNHGSVPGASPLFYFIFSHPFYFWQRNWGILFLSLATVYSSIIYPPE